MTDFDPLYLTRPGADKIAGARVSPAEQVSPGIWLSQGLSNSFLLTTSEGRIVVNTGMGFEGPVHRANYDAVDESPVRYVVLTQGHYDHVGGADAFTGPDTDIIAQANWEIWRRDNELLADFRANNSAFAWANQVVAAMAHTKEQFGALPGQSAPRPTIVVDDRMGLTVGGPTARTVCHTRR